MNNTNNNKIDLLIVKLSEKMPFTFTRTEVPILLGKIIAKGTLANLASKNIGPPSLRSKRNVIYERDEFLAWLRIYLTGGIKALRQLKEKSEEQ